MDNLFLRLMLLGRTQKSELNIVLICCLSSIMLGITKHARAQKADFQNVSVKYTLLPPIQLPADVASYRPVIAPDSGVHVDIELSNSWRNQLILEGIKRVEEKPDLEVALILGEIKIPSIDPSSYVYYILPARLKVRSYSGKAILDTNITFKQQYMKFSPSPGKTKEQFANEWERNKRFYYSSWEDELIKQYIAVVNDMLKQKFSYVTLTSNLKIGIAENDRKSTFDYATYQKAYDKIKAGLLKRIPENVSTGNDEINEAIKIWEDEINKADPGKKDARIDKKILYATHINCAVGYLWLFNFEKAEEHINKADGLKSLFSGGDFKELKNTIQLLKERYGFHQGWTGSRKTEPRKSQESIFDKDNLIARARENNAWLKENPIPDPNKPDMSNPRAKLITANTWKYNKIVQILPDGTNKPVYELNVLDGAGLLSNKKIRYKFNSDGKYTYVNPLGQIQPDGKWQFRETNEIMMGFEISEIITLTNTAFTYKSGKAGSFQVIFYLIPE